MSNLISPRSWLFSILFFTVELFILFHVRRTDKIAPLLALPPLFALWANLHMQFIYGLAVLGLFLVEVLLSQLPSLSLCPPVVLISPLGEYHFYYWRVWLQL